jgi:hypothetical protein
VEYETPAVTKVTEVGEPLIGVIIDSGKANPKWNDAEDAS